MKYIRFIIPLLFAASAYGAGCGVIALNPLTGLLDCTGPAGGSGTVTSVGFTGGIISIATATTTPAFTVAGTSGGVVCFTGAATWASSAALATTQFVLGGGAGACPVSLGTDLTYTAATHTLLGGASLVVDWTASTVSLPAIFVHTDLAFVMGAGKSGTFTPSASVAGLVVAAGTPSGQVAGGMFMDNSAGFGWSNGTAKGLFTNPATAARTWTMQDASYTVIGRDTTDTLTNKTINASQLVAASVASTQLATANKTFTKSFNIENPTTADTYLWFFEEAKAITLTRVACNVIGGTNLVINFYKTSEATSGSGGTKLLNSDLTCTAGALVASTTFAVATVATRLPVALTVTSASGTNTFVHVIVEFTVD